MKEITIPIPSNLSEEIADIEVKIGRNKIQYSFRVESFPWETEDELSNGGDEISKSLARITRLRNAIKNYDRNWKLIQIYQPPENAKNIQVLYRKRGTGR
jgi:hypothetical protein